MQEECIFCKIANKKLPTNIIYENNEFLAFNDIQPKAKIHYLIIPKQHIATLNDCNINNHLDLLGKMMLLASKIAKEQNFADYGYFVKMHCNKGGGQEVYHIHLHLLSNFNKL